jgi:hypothetical protein
MKRFPWLALLFALPAWGQAPQVPERHVVRSLHDADAARLLKECDRGLTDATIERLLKDYREPKAEADGALAEFASRDSRFHVLVSGSSWTCLPFSATDYPIWPVESLRRTIIPVAATPTTLPAAPVMTISLEAVNAWRRALILQIADSGLARGLIVFANGAGHAVYYTASKGRGMFVRYEGRALKAGEFRPEDYPAVLNTPGVTAVSEVSYGANRDKSRPAFSTRFGGIPRTLVDGSYLSLKGNPETAAAQFGGTVWKNEGDIGATELRLEKDGVAISKSAQNTSLGSWRLAGDVLRVEFNNFSFYSLALQENRFLAGEGRRKPIAPNPSMRIPTTIDDDAPQDTYFKPRYYRPTDLAHEDRLRGEKVARFDALLARVELQRRAILAESPEEEERLQREVVARIGKPEFNWRSCGQSEQAELMMTLMADRQINRIGEICHSWMGTRKEWKATILTEGCKGRCRAF